VKPIVRCGDSLRRLRAREIRIHEAGEFRVLYVADLPEAIYVLSAFENKTRKAPQRELDLAVDRFRSVAEERRRLQR
jgi:phage-related protein